jgi:hypothetical protein
MDTTRHDVIGLVVVPFRPRARPQHRPPPAMPYLIEVRQEETEELKLRLPGRSALPAGSLLEELLGGVGDMTGADAGRVEQFLAGA